MRKNIVAGNWKMNNDLAATKTLISELIELKKTSNSEIMIAPTFVNLLEASKLLKETSIQVVSQNNSIYTNSFQHFC